MLVMSFPSTTNEPESCSSEGSSCTTSSVTTSDLSSMSAHTHANIPSLSDDPDTSSHKAPPPPPLPPPLPPDVPPPPPPPAITSSNQNTRKKRRVRSFFWKPIPEERVREKPNIWTLAVRQQQYQIDVRSVEELFGQQEDASSGVRGPTPATGTSTRVSRSTCVICNPTESKYPTSRSNSSIVEDIRQGEGKNYGAELLKDLLRLLPDAEEVYLMNCEELHAILHLVLQAGNILNAGGYAGNAAGFKLSSLLSLADTKANKPGMNLLHFVAMEAKKKDENLLRFPEKLQDVQRASRVSVENIEVEFSSLYVRIKSLEEKIQGDQELLQQLEPFLQVKLQDLKRRRLDLRKEGNALIDFFCEDKDTFKLDECFRIFQDFCIKFKKAVKDNMDRELKEAARERRLRELEEKRFAWSGADQSFGRSSSENDVEMLTKEGLLDFFQQRSESPHSPMGRSASARRHRHTMTSIADRELKGYLEIFGGSGNPSDYSKFNSLPRTGRTVQRRTIPWISAQDDNRELDRDRTVRSPHAETELISPLAVFSSPGPYDNDPYSINNNKYSSLSESSALPRSFSVFQKPVNLPNPTISSHMNVSVEKHTLVPGPQAFDLPSPNNNSNHMNFVNHGDVVVTDLEREQRRLPLRLDNLVRNRVLERGADAKAALEGTLDLHQQVGISPEREKEEEDHSTLSSTTCDTPLPLDTSASKQKPVFYIVDCSETDCSVTFDYSETESSFLMKEGLHFRSKEQENQQDPSSLSSNLDYMSPNDQPVSELKCVDAASMTPSATTEEWDTESCDTAEGKPSSVRDTQRNSRKPAHTKSKAGKATKSSGGHGVRTLTSTENLSMRKVLPISKITRTGSIKRAERPSAHDSGESQRPLRDQSTPPRGRSEKTTRPLRHSSLPPDESKAQRGSSLTGTFSRWANDATQKKASVHKPSTKPVRNIPKPPPEEKMSSSENSSCNTLSARNNSDVPSFARNTVASTTRTKKELGVPSIPTTPVGTPSILNRHTSVKQTRFSPSVANGEERPQGTNLRRVQSVKVSRSSAFVSETPPPLPTREDIRKTTNALEKAVPSKDSMTPSRSTKPTWK
uniref:FH2 domain containing 1 n=1 Tax=Labrus bergylta TaxID=56723 RepID=A0A3Q3EDZ2_9LABR